MSLCALVCFILVVSCFLGKFLVKAPSLTWLLQGKKTCLHLDKETRVF